MSGPAIRNPTPSWLRRENASVLDSPLEQLARMLASIIGADDPSGQAMGIAAPVDVPVGATSPIAQALSAVGKKLKGIKAYHGSPHDFDQFDMSKAGSTTDRGFLGRGMYFSTDENVAGTRPHRYEVDLSIQSPLELEMPSWGGNKTEILASKLGVPLDSTAEQLTAAARAQGHDSVVMDYSPIGYNKKEIAVFDDQLISIVKKYGIAGALSAGLINQTQAQQLKEQGY